MPLLREENSRARQFDGRLRPRDRSCQPICPLHGEKDVIRTPYDESRCLQLAQPRLDYHGVFVVPRRYEALQIARDLARSAKSATDLHNAFFGIGGKFSELFPTRAEREAFAQTPEYQEIVRLRAQLGQREKAAS